MAIMIGMLSLTSTMSVFAEMKQMPDGTIFDAKSYAQMNPDVVMGLRRWTNEENLYLHYVNQGKAEGRLAYEGAKAVPNPIAGATLVNVYTARPLIAGNDGVGHYELYSNGIWLSKVTEADLQCVSEMIERKYLLYRTNFSDGLLDEDNNGIDDRDPYNESGYTDFNNNCIADGMQYSVLQVARWTPEGEFEKIYGYKIDNPADTTGNKQFYACEHGVLDGTYICQKCAAENYEKFWSRLQPINQ